MNLGAFWPKLVPAILAFVLFASVSRPRQEAARFVAFIIVVMLARDFLFSVVDDVRVYQLSDLVLMTLYVAWVRAYTGWRVSDTVFLILNGLVAAAGIASIFLFYISYFAQSEFILGLWVLVNVAYLAVVAGLVSSLDTEKAEIVLRSRFVLVAALFIIFLIALLYGYHNPSVQGILVPASYLAPAYLLLSYDAVRHHEEEQSVQFYSANLEATYGFMENLGNAITAKIDLARVLDLIISAAVKNIGADAGAILMIDEYQDVLRVKATYGIYPPLSPVPELARVNPASLKRYFAETPLPIGETILGETVRSGKPVFIRDARQDDRMSANSADDILFVSSLAIVPLVVRNRSLGALSVLKRVENQFFEEHDFQHLTTLAEFASITIDNLFTYVEVLEKREIDREVDIAAQIQQKLLPAKLPEMASAELAVYSMPAKV